MVTTTIISRINELKTSLGGWTWPVAVTLTRNAVLSTFSNLEKGHLLIVDGVEGTEHSFGQKNIGKQNETPKRNASTLPSTEVIVKRDTFWIRLFLFADMGFAEGYMLGDFECNDLTSFFRLFILNKEKLEAGRNIFWSLRNMITRLGQSTNTLANSLLNTSAHYDISNEMFAAFLSTDMTYSCPIWRLQDGRDAKAAEEALEDAQQTKLLRFIEGAKIKADDHVLEIGTGWGSFAIEAVKQTGCRITSITLSLKQQQLAEQRIRIAGLSDRIKVKLMDYRQLPALNQIFDKIVSIEMIEAVGEKNLGEYFAVIHKVLKPKGGIAMFQCITMPEAQHTADANKKEFIGQYIFPGGYLPSTMQLLNHISTQSQGTLTVENVENIGGHYSKALRLWRDSFLLHFDDKILPALTQSQPTMSKEGIEVFRRKWEYYFSYCEAGFITKILNDVIITVSRPEAMELMEGVPL